MKKKYLLTILVFIVVIIFVFRDNIINLSIPLFENKIKNQLNITDNKDTELEIKTNFIEKTLTLTANNVFIKNSNHNKNGSIKSIVVVKDFKDFFNSKISKITIDNLDITLINYEINKTKNQERVIEDILFNLKMTSKNFGKVTINNSKIDLSSIIKNHYIYIDNFISFDGIKKINSEGTIKNGLNISKYKLFENKKNSNLLNLEIKLNSYSFNYLNDLIEMDNIKNIFNREYNGQIVLINNFDLSDFNANYDIKSEDKNIIIEGNYIQKKNIVNSKIEIKNTKLENYLANIKIFDLIDISQFGKFDMNFNIVDNFNDIQFYIKNENADFFAKGTINNKLIDTLKLDISDFALEESLKNIEVFKSIDISKLGKLSVNLDTINNFENTNFYIENKKQNFIAQGILKNNQISELNIEGKEFNFEDIFQIANFQSDLIPIWIYDTMIRDNDISYKLNYPSLKNSDVLDLEIIDKYKNIIKANFNLENFYLDSININFFNNKKNNLLWNKKTRKFNMIIDRDFKNFLINKFEKNIFEYLNIDYFNDFDLIKIEGTTKEKAFSKIGNFISFNDYFDQFSVFIKNANVDFNKLKFSDNFIKIQGNIDVNYTKDNISQSNDIFIDFHKSKIQIKKIEYLKDINDPLQANFSYETNLNNENIIKDLKIRGKETYIDANIFFKNNFIDKVDISSFKILDNNFELLLINDTIQNSNNKEFTLSINGKALDLSFLDIKKTKSTFRDIIINLEINVKKFEYLNNTVFSPVEIQGQFKNVWQNLNFNGLFDTGEELIIKINSINGERIFDINSTNSGKTLRIKDITKSITGGNLKFYGKYKSNNDDNFFESSLTLENFAIKKKSKLANFIKVIRVFDIKKQLDGDTEDFEYAEMKITKFNHIYQITDGKAYGGLMALTAEGNINKDENDIDIKGIVAPTHGIDSWVGNIPILGAIMTGIEGGGVVAANYSVKGKIKDPKYFVNPLSVLTPGIFKEFWKIFEVPQSKKTN